MGGSRSSGGSGAAGGGSGVGSGSPRPERPPVPRLEDIRQYRRGERIIDSNPMAQNSFFREFGTMTPAADDYANYVMRRVTGTYDWQGIRDIGGPSGLSYLANLELRKLARRGGISRGYRIYENPVDESQSLYYLGRG